MKKAILSAVVMMAATMCLAQRVKIITSDTTCTFEILKDDKLVLSPPAEEGLMAVDLGLSSGTKWANMNVGASRVTEYGSYFMWGYTTDCSTANCNKSNCNTYNKDIAEWQGNATYDAATAIMGSDWVTPTKEQMKELYDGCSRESTTRTDSDGNVVKGWKFTSKVNGNSIFIPAGGYRNNYAFSEQEVQSVCWTCSLYYKEESNKGAATVCKYGGGEELYQDFGDRYTGIPIRAVQLKQ